MRSVIFPLIAITILATANAVRADDKRTSNIQRGKYLVEFGGCNDCHTPGYFLGKADTSRYLGGSDVGFKVPDGVYVGPNLTPDKETGLGSWSKQDIVTALQTGLRPDGRILSTIMPWQAFAGLTKDDADAIADYLKSLPPIHHKVGGPFGAAEKPSVAVLALKPADRVPDNGVGAVGK
jgi:mono/diheme cytochrome c family protein